MIALRALSALSLAPTCGVVSGRSFEAPTSAAVFVRTTNFAP